MEDPYLEYLNTKYRFPRSLVHRPIQRFFAGHLRELPDGAPILDAGCGNGIESGPHADRLEVHGIDYQPSYVEYCRKQYPAAHYEVGDLEAIDFPDASFEVVVMNQVIEHLASPQKVAWELSRVLRPGGRLLVATPNYATRAWRLIENTYHRWFVEEFDAEENHVTHYDPRMLREHLSGPLQVELVDTVCLGMILVASGAKAA